MEYSYAKYVADSVVAKLAPSCDKIKVCGGVRRHKPEPHDVDIVVIPRRDVWKDMFGDVIPSPPVPEFIATVNQWTKLKGDPDGKYTQRLLKNGVKLEISIATPDNFGALVLIRTGDADFSQMIMKRVLKCGLQQKDGFLWNEDKIIPLHEEEDYFKVLNLPYIEPSKRDINAFK